MSEENIDRLTSAIQRAEQICDSLLKLSEKVNVSSGALGISSEAKALLQRYGYSEEESQQIFDPRLRRLLEAHARLEVRFS